MASAKTPAIWAVVPAAGTGSRMQAALPKQYLPLLNHTVLDITLSKLLRLEFLGGVVVALASTDEYWPQCTYANEDKIHTVVGGESRADSVLAGLNYCLEHGGPQAWALVHDAARPCVTEQNIRELVSFTLNSRAADNAAGAILAVPCADTIKRVKTQNILATEDRQQLWLAHTPQLFPVVLLAKAIDQALRENTVITDEASAVEAAGLNVKVFQDRRDNIKITLPEDLLWAEMILKRQDYHL